MNLKYEPVRTANRQKRDFAATVGKQVSFNYQLLVVFVLVIAYDYLLLDCALQSKILIYQFESWFVSSDRSRQVTS